jgi:hypothetical protein
LEQAPAVELGDQDLTEFAPGADPRPDGYKPYLIRALVMKGWDGRPIGNGALMLWRRGPNLWVKFGFLGMIGPKSEAKDPLVVWLPFQPENVYVETQ